MKMKKLFPIAAICLLFAGTFASCEAETSVEDTEALYNLEVQAGEDDNHQVNGRNG